MMMAVSPPPSRLRQDLSVRSVEQLLHDRHSRVAYSLVASAAEFKMDAILAHLNYFRI